MVTSSSAIDRKPSEEVVALAQEYKEHSDPRIRAMAMSIISQARGRGLIQVGDTQQALLAKANELNRGGWIPQRVWDLFELYDAHLSYANLVAAWAVWREFESTTFTKAG